MILTRKYANRSRNICQFQNHINILKVSTTISNFRREHFAHKLGSMGLSAWDKKFIIKKEKKTHQIIPSLRKMNSVP